MPHSVADNLEILLTGMRSPMDHNTCCAFVMFRACCMMDRPNAKPSSELIRAAMQFLLGHRTPAEHEALTERLLSCSCRIYDSSRVPPILLQGLDFFLAFLCQIIGWTLRDLKPAKFRKRKPNRPARRQPWPHGIADIGLHDNCSGDVMEILLLWTSPAPVGSGDIPVATTLCGRCGVVNYCSSQRQKLAWSAERCLHKDICCVIARFRGKLGLARPPMSGSVDKEAVRLVDEAWRKWLVRTEVGRARVAMRDSGIEPRTCRTIWLHIRFLNRAKRLIPLYWRIVWCGYVGRLGEFFKTSYIEDFV
ncbi:hypothetical protein K438DRAFT_2028847 [Mycena galopus ATCC 62051]|nr:hypothetical protein K438DRAFT_2028847 [Mycena galopus ATCC 62051]